MDLFTKKEKGKEILDNGRKVIINLKSNGKFEIEVTQSMIKVSPKGFINAVNKGLVGQKTYKIENLTGVQYKKPGLTTGYIQFVLLGSRESKRGVTGAVHDENSITFSNKKEALLMLELKEFIEDKMNSIQTKNSNFSTADELLKLKQLLDSGVINEKEFEAEKRKILG